MNAVAHRQIADFSVGNIGIRHIDANVQVVGDHVGCQRYPGRGVGNVDAVTGALDPQVLDGDVADTGQVEHVGAGRGVVAVERRDGAVGRAGDQQRVARAAGIGRRQNDVGRQDIVAGIDQDRVAGTDRIGAQQRGDARHRLVRATRRSWHRCQARRYTARHSDCTPPRAAPHRRRCCCLPAGTAATCR